ncbi:MAG TPA: glycosyltransferase family 4 protein [Acidimicrobiales bacterium]|nr:glycosyltransferase family 4 protein [Acidimicrobiales bacterium]
MATVVQPVGSRRVKVLVFPRDLTNPYQRLLYDEVEQLGVEVEYVPMPTSSQTQNLLLIPWVLLCRAVRGFRVFHVHWMYLFAPPWVRRVPAGRRLMELWSVVCFGVARLLGYRIVWTAHNIVPNSRVFTDDLAARRRLARRASAVIAHSQTAVTSLRSLGAADVRVVPMGSYAGEYPDTLDRSEARRRFGIGEHERVAVFVGAIAPYKGVDRLLEAVRRLPPGLPLRVVVAGRCQSSRLEQSLQSSAEAAGAQVLAHLGYIPDDELQVYLRCADVAVLPYRRITNSASVVLAASFGLPLVIPDLPALDDVPLEAAIRFAPGLEALVDALHRVALLDAGTLQRLARAASDYGRSLSWQRCAFSTVEVYRDVVAAAR